MNTSLDKYRKPPTYIDKNRVGEYGFVFTSPERGSDATRSIPEEAIEIVARWFYDYQNNDPDAYRSWETIGRRERAVCLDEAEDLIRRLNRGGYCIAKDVTA